MIRWIQNILDIKNILWMDRVPPIPDPQTMHSRVYLKSSETGQYTIIVSRVVTYWQVDYVDSDGNEQIAFSASNPNLSISVLGGSVINIINGNDHAFWGISQMDERTQYVSVSRRLNYIRTGSGRADGLQYIDLRNAEDLMELPIAANLKTLYAKATTETLRDLCLTLLNNSVSRGVLWISESDTYAQDVVALARTKGWKVYYL